MVVSSVDSVKNLQMLAVGIHCRGELAVLDLALATGQLEQVPVRHHGSSHEPSQ
jgi:hypothetical protein